MVQDHQGHGERTNTVELWQTLPRASAFIVFGTTKKVAPTKSSSTIRYRFNTRAYCDLLSSYHLSVSYSSIAGADLLRRCALL